MTLALAAPEDIMVYQYELGERFFMITKGEVIV